MKYKDRISERGHLESAQKRTFNTQLQSLKSLETATKRRRARKKKAASNSAGAKSAATTSG
jgi:hypothetical protein